jgi:hypothetical protein
VGGVFFEWQLAHFIPLVDGGCWQAEFELLGDGTDELV